MVLKDRETELCSRWTAESLGTEISQGFNKTTWQNGSSDNTEGVNSWSATDVFNHMNTKFSRWYSYCNRVLFKSSVISVATPFLSAVSVIDPNILHVCMTYWKLVLH